MNLIDWTSQSWVEGTSAVSFPVLAQQHRAQYFRTFPEIVDLSALLLDHTSWVVLPSEENVAAPSLSRLISAIRRMTGWSQRDIASVLGTSHTTVRKLETDGAVTPRSRNVAARVPQTYEILKRLSIFATPEVLATVLATANDEGVRPSDLLLEGRYGEAYLLALEIIHPRPKMFVAEDGWSNADATRELF